MRRLLVGLLVLWGVVCSAQSPLYRGRLEPEYDFRFNGHYFWNTPRFIEGTVFYNGTLYSGVPMNINSHTRNLLVRENGFLPPVALERSLVGWFEIDGERYVNLQAAGVAEIPEGFYKVLTDGHKVYYYRRDKEFAREVGNHNGEKIIGYEDPNYRDYVLAYFYVRDYWYTVKKGVAKRVRPGKRKRASMVTASVPEIDGSIYEELREVSRPAPFRVAGDTAELPTGWFSKEGPSAGVEALMAAIDRDNLIASYRNKTYEIGGATRVSGTAVVRGAVRDVATGELIPGVLVSASEGGAYAYTDKDGHYSLKLTPGDNLLTFSEYSYEDMAIRVIVNATGGLDIVMREKVTALKSAYVTANGMADHRRAGMGLEKISSGTITHIPSAFGEGDVLKAVLTLPGVKTVGEASSGFNVRGGSADQNLILFDGGTIYNPSHLFGIFSAFNTDVVDEVELYKSSIPVKYGGRISSVLDISTQDGNNEKIKGSLGIGLLTSHLALDGPIVKDKTTFILGGRTTYSDWLLGLLPEKSGYAGGKASFSDVNLGVTHRFDDRNTLKVNGYWSRDGFAFRGDTTFRYSNLDLAVKWHRKFKSEGALTVSAGFDRYSNTMRRGYNTDVTGAYELGTCIREAYTRAMVENPLGNHRLTWGADAVFYALDPGTLSPIDSSLVIPRSLRTELALEPAVYVGDEWNIGGGPFTLDYGVRLSGFTSLNDGKFYAGPEFRLSGKYTPRPNLSFKAGFNSMNQYIHLLSNSASISPMDTWKLCDADILPQKGFQAAAGAYWTVFGNALDITLEGYYKQVVNYPDYRSGAVLSMNENLAADLIRTRAKSYGVEFMLRKQTGRLTGWVSYTWSRALLQDMQNTGAEAINGGAWYNAPYDKPHDVKLVGNYKFTHRYSISFNLDYSTGRPVTLPVGQYYYGNAMRLLYSDRNAYRIPDYFRLDLAMNIEPGHYLKAFTHMSATFGCYNVTGRRNAYSVFYTTSGGSGVHGYMVSVFATQIPYLSLNLKF